MAMQARALAGPEGLEAEQRGVLELVDQALGEVTLVYKQLDVAASLARHSLQARRLEWTIERMTG